MFAVPVALVLAAYQLNTTHLDCGVRRLLYERALKLQPWRDLHTVFDALELSTLCGDAPRQRQAPAVLRRTLASAGYTATVCPVHGSDDPAHPQLGSPRPWLA